jgi:hypothetical protein
MTSFPIFLILFSVAYLIFATVNGPAPEQVARKQDDWAISGLIFVVSYLSALFFDVAWPIFAGFLAILGFP